MAKFEELFKPGDIIWMLQTDSYRFHYLYRLEQLEQRILEILGEL
jgi:hypothetical protein